MYILKNISPKTRIFLLVIIFLIGCISLPVWYYAQQSIKSKVPVDITTVPDNISVEIDGVDYGSSKRVYIIPGKKYTIKAHSNGFHDQAFTQYIDANNHTLLISLRGESEEAKKWEQDNQDKYSSLEGSSGELSVKEGKSFIDRNPIVDALPYENFIYSIGYRADTSDPSSNSIIISINAPEGSRNAAVQQIRDLGYDPTDYKIEFSDYRNPFAL